MVIIRNYIGRSLCRFLGVLLIWTICTKPGVGQGQQQSGSSHSLSNRDFLTKSLRATGFIIVQQGHEQWKTAQRNLYIHKVRSLPDSIKSYYVAKADAALLFDWPTLKAYDYLQYKREGNRVDFERQLEKRSLSLNYLVMGALITGDEKYLPQIVNGLWVMLEQSSWEIPAIIGLQKRGTDLPDPGEQIIGLVAAETAANIATTSFMLYDQLEKISPVINLKIKKELQDRILLPYMARTDFWWMGLRGQKVNNWNVWINTNVLITGLLTESESDLLNPLIRKVFESTDQFINQYPADGGCDEGPAYWSIASGKLITLLQFASSISGGKLNWSDNQLIHSMGSYIYKMHIDGDYFVNFADAAPKVIPNPGSVYAFGQMFQDDTLKAFGGYLLSLNHYRLPEVNLIDFLSSSVRFEKMSSAGRRLPGADHAFLPELEVFTGRSGGTHDDGLFLAVQGGNNDQSHNHNDVGNFLLYVDGSPVIVDAGVGTYTALTFSKRRYELWNMQSAWHNLPVINGFMQEAGAQYKASAVSFEQDSKHRKLHISMDIAKAYPPGAALKRWQRDFRLDRYPSTEKLTITENYALLADSASTGTEINFLSYCAVRQAEKGRKAMKGIKTGELYFYNQEGKILLTMKYDQALMDFSVEKKVLVDPKMVSHWGKQLYRLSFKLKKSSLKGRHQFVFQKPASALK